MAMRNRRTNAGIKKRPMIRRLTEAGGLIVEALLVKEARIYESTARETLAMTAPTHCNARDKASPGGSRPSHWF